MTEKDRLANWFIEAYELNPTLIANAISQLDRSGELLSIVREVVREAREEAPLVKPDPRPRDYEGWDL